MKRIGLAATVLFLVAQTASVPVAAADGKRFATVVRVQGEITAGGPNVKGRPLREGEPVFVGERIRSTSTGEALLKTDDGGMVAVRPGAEFVAQNYSAEGKSTDNVSLRLISGSLRLISGWIGKLNRAGSIVETPTSTIGIRGTDHEPYVLSPELAAATGSPEGTYDKVNRGGTTLAVGANKVDIDPGRVGFVRNPPKAKERALMTLLLPVLLDKVPGFYVPGRFDAELDQYSPGADEASRKLLEEKQKAAGPAPLAECAPAAIAGEWLGQLDGAILRGDAPTIIAMFAPEVAVRANVRGNDGALSSIDLKREEFVDSTVAAIKGLKDYKQRRVSVDAGTADAGSACESIRLKSVVIEQGLQSGQPFRFESLEEYLLVRRAGKWLALKAETTQR